MWRRMSPLLGGSYTLRLNVSLGVFRRRPAYGVELVTDWSVKLGAYSQMTLRSQLLPGLW